MKTKLAIMVLGALVLTANGAGAQPRENSHTHIRHPSRIFGQSYGYAPRVVQRYRLSAGVYESYSQGRQSYPNPDRGPYPAPVGAAYL